MGRGQRKLRCFSTVINEDYIFHFILGMWNLFYFFTLEILASRCFRRNLHIPNDLHSLSLVIAIFLIALKYSPSYRSDGLDCRYKFICTEYKFSLLIFWVSIGDFVSSHSMRNKQNLCGWSPNLVLQLINSVDMNKSMNSETQFHSM